MARFIDLILKKNPAKRLTNLQRIASVIEGHPSWQQGAGRAWEGHYDIALLADEAGLSPEQTERVILSQNKNLLNQLGLSYAKIKENAGRRALRFMREE